MAVVQHGVVAVHGSGFGQGDFNHVRIVFLPPEELLEEAYDHIAAYSAKVLAGQA